MKATLSASANAPTSIALADNLFAQASGRAAPPQPPPAASSSGSSAAPSTPTLAHAVRDDADGRYRVALELMQTEESYGAAVRLVKNTLMAPLSQAAILPAPVITKVFSCCDRISELSDEIHEQLKARLRAWDTARTIVSDVFTHQMESAGIFGSSRLADLYVQYVNNFEQSQRTLRSIDDVTEWGYFQKHWKLLTVATGCGDHTIASLLIQPVQRIPRYKLLLEQLLKATPEAHPDHAPTQAALEMVSAVAHKVNTAIKRREAVEAVYELQSEFVGGELVRPGRYLVKRVDDVKSRLTVSATEKTDERSKQLTLTLVAFSGSHSLCTLVPACTQLHCACGATLSHPDASYMHHSLHRVCRSSSATLS